MVLWMIMGVWQTQAVGYGSIGEEALCLDSAGVVHLFYKSSDRFLVHRWFDKNSWKAETLGICGSLAPPPTARVDARGRLHVIIGGYGLFYYYRSDTGWCKYWLPYNTKDYDLIVLNTRPRVLFSISGKIIRGVGDTLGNFTFKVIDSSWSKESDPPPPYYYSGAMVRGPVALYRDEELYFWCHYYYMGKGFKNPTPTCWSQYGHLAGDECSDCGKACCSDRLVYEIASEFDFLIYYSSGNGLKTYPGRIPVSGFHNADICYRDTFLLSAVDRDTRRVCFLKQQDTSWWVEVVDTLETEGPTSIVAIDTNQVFVAYKDTSDMIHVAVRSPRSPSQPRPIPWDPGFNSLKPGFLKGNILIRDTWYDHGDLVFVPAVDGNMVARLYSSDGILVMSTSMAVQSHQEVRLQLPPLGTGVFYFVVSIGNNRGMWRLVIL